jgi:hypothetical protein
VNDYFPKAVRGTPLHQLVTATTLYDYIEQGPSKISMSNPGDKGALVDPVNRPAFGYILNLLCVYLLFKFYLSLNLNTCTCFTLTGSLITAMNLLIISEIKMYLSSRPLRRHPHPPGGGAGNPRRCTFGRVPNAFERMYIA